MRILHAADFGGTAPGGFVPLIVALARRLSDRGDPFALAVPEVGATWHSAVRDAGAELHAVRDGSEAASFARAWRPDVAHVHFFGWELPLTRALWTARTRVFWHAHSTSIRDGRVRSGVRSTIKYRVVGARVERFVAVSRTVAAEIVTLGAPRRRVTVIANEIDRARFHSPRDDERAEARAMLGLDDRPTILFFGRDPHLKGADVLLDALREIDGAVVLCVGTPCETRASFARVATVVDVPRAEDVRPMLWAADALAIPSRGEGAPFVVLEALASGLPIAAADIPALREAAGDSSRTAFAAPGDAHGFAGALRRALERGRTYHPVATAGEGTNRWAAAIEGLYREPRAGG